MTLAQDLATRLTAAYNAGDAAAIGACYAEDATQLRTMGEPLRGRQAIQDAAAAILPGFSDINFKVEGLIEQGEWAALEVQFSGKHTARFIMNGQPFIQTGNVIKFLACSMVRLNSDGLIAEEHRYQDNAALVAALNAPSVR